MVISSDDIDRYSLTDVLIANVCVKNLVDKICIPSDCNVASYLHHRETYITSKVVALFSYFIQRMF